MRTSFQSGHVILDLGRVGQFVPDNQDIKIEKNHKFLGKTCVILSILAFERRKKREECNNSVKCAFLPRAAMQSSSMNDVVLISLGQ